MYFTDLSINLLCVFIYLCKNTLYNYISYFYIYIIKTFRSASMSGEP